MFDKYLKNLVAVITFAVITFAAFANACSPEVGSEGWCADKKGQDKATRNAEDAGNFAKHCIM